MGMVKMEHVNIYGDGREPRAALELLAGLSCFDPARRKKTCSSPCWRRRWAF